MDGRRLGKVLATEMELGSKKCTCERQNEDSRRNKLRKSSERAQEDQR